VHSASAQNSLLNNSAVQSTNDEPRNSSSMVWAPKPVKCVWIQWDQNLFWPCTKTDSGTQPASYLIHYWRHFLHKEPGCDSNHSSQSSAVPP